MSDLDAGAVPAASEPVVAPVETQAPEAQAPEPVKNDPIPDPRKAEQAEEKPKNAREAVERARAKVDEKEKAEAKPDKQPDPKQVKAEDKAQDKQPGKPDQKPADRDETGRFKQREAEQKPTDQPEQRSKFEAPKRFDPEAQKDWHRAPESVQGAINRALRENEEGLQKYKASHERYEQFREFDDMAKANGRDLKESITKLVEFERAMQQNPLGALNYALREVGPRGPDGRPMTIDDIVAHVHGQSGDQRLQAAQQEIAQLRQEVERMHAGRQAEEMQRRIPDEVAKFASENERFEELTETIAVLIENGMAKDLKSAYALAASLRPATNGAHTPDKNGAHTATPDDDAEAQTLKAQEEAAAKAARTPKGSPTGGASRPDRAPATSIRESLRRAIAQSG